MQKNSTHCCPLCKSKKINKIFVSRNQHGRDLLDGKDAFDVFLCSECRAVFLEKMVINAEYYKKYYQQGYYGKSGQSFMKKLAEKLVGLLTKYVIYKKEKLIFRCLGKREKISILDVGCGVGIFLLGLNSGKFIKSGVEINPEAVAVCKKKGIEICAQNLLDIDDHKKFDVITLWHVLEHVDNPAEMLIKIRSLLSGKGILIFEVPNTDSLGYKFGKADWFHLDSPRHLILYNKKSVQKICEMTGFSVIKIKSEIVDYPLDLFWSVKKSPIRCFFYLLYPLAKWLSQETLMFVCKPNRR